jgi:type IV secretory pathway TrbD component
MKTRILGHLRSFDEDVLLMNASSLMILILGSFAAMLVLGILSALVS